MIVIEQLRNLFSRQHRHDEIDKLVLRLCIYMEQLEDCDAIPNKVKEPVYNGVELLYERWTDSLFLIENELVDAADAAKDIPQISEIALCPIYAILNVSQGKPKLDEIKKLDDTFSLFADKFQTPLRHRYESILNAPVYS